METPLHLIHGPAGTGKTWGIREKMKKDPSFAKLCATTGIAAINLGDGIAGESITTINSALAYFDVDSLRESLESGKLLRILKSIKATKRFIVLDEASMLDALSFDCLVNSLDAINALVDEESGERPLGLILVGDFCQLSPVKGEYAFCSGQFERVKITSLSVIKRQNDPKFQEMLGFARSGDGSTVAKLLKEYNCLATEASEASDITTIYSVNASVDAWNSAKLQALMKTRPKSYTVPSNRWGRARGEWKEIPDNFLCAVGAYVMILSNDLAIQGYANGDCGTIADVGPTEVSIRLKRGDKLVKLKKVLRQNHSPEAPQGFDEPPYLRKREFATQEIERLLSEGRSKEEIKALNWNDEYRSYCAAETFKNRQARIKPSDPFFDVGERKWVIGEVFYLPLRLAYASTVHKCQGLTLDNIQVIIGQPGGKAEDFFGKPNMLYVALSRARTLEGLKVVGTQAQVAKICNTSRRLLAWI